MGTGGNNTLVSRTRCGILYAAPQSRDPGSNAIVTGTPALQRTVSQELHAALRPGHDDHPRRGSAVKVPVMIAIRFSAPSCCAKACASHTVNVRPGLTTRARNTNRSPFAGASRLVLNSTVRMSELAGI